MIPQPPRKPAHMARRDAAVRAADTALYRALTNFVLYREAPPMAELKANTIAVREAFAAPTTAAEDADAMRYHREVDEYNASVDAHNEAIRARQQARVNAAEVRAIRAAACPQCFSTHAGEC